MIVVAAKIDARGKLGVKLVSVSLEADTGVLAVVGAPRDGTALLFDVLDGTLPVTSGSVRVPERAKIARLTTDAPLPDGLRVDEVCALSADLRGEPRVDPLPALNLELFARRRVQSLSVDERRAVALAIALGSKAELLLIEEPLALLAPVAPRLVVDAIRERSKTACVVAVTSSPRDATRVGDRIAVLLDGKLTPIEESNAVSRDAGSLRIVVSGGAQRAGSEAAAQGAAALIGALGQEDAVSRVDSAGFADGRGTALVVHGPDLAALAKAVTHAIAVAKVDVDVVEPSVLPLDAIRDAIRAQLGAPA